MERDPGQGEMQFCEGGEHTDITRLATDSWPYVAAVLTQATERSADATVTFGQRILQRGRRSAATA
ncbi:MULTISPECIES: hypothetical protein [Streptomyces]|uniref:Uncharacterized protein n=1 Tax=Streptomyces fimbriatus TaxID=68197 RepID=A0ABW0D1I0_STRFI